MSKQMKRTVGLWGGIATAVGIVVSSSAMVSLGEGFGLGGSGFIIAIGLALILNLFVALSFSELSGIVPRAGGLNHYTLPAMGPLVGNIAVISGYVLVTVFSGSAEAAIIGNVFTDVFSLNVSPLIISLLAVALLGFTNLFGVKVFSSIQVVLTTFLISSTIILGIIAITGSGTGETVSTNLEFNPMGWSVLSLTALAFWLFVGVEFVTPLAEEIKRPNMFIPLSMVLGLVIIFIAHTLFGFGAIKYAPLDNLAESGSPHVVAAEAILGQTGYFWMGIVTVLATTSTLNTLINAIARMIYDMGREGQMPKVFGKLNRWGTPSAAILFMSFLFVFFLIIGFTEGTSITTFILAGSLCWMIAYIIAHLNVIILRFRYPAAKRGFKSPFGVTFQIIGIVGLIYIIFNISSDPSQAADVYKYSLIFLGLSVIYSYIWVKYVMKRPVFQPVPLDELTNHRQHSTEEHSIDDKEDISNV
ncbi:APC family permease [Lentibacillus halophilus]|uniref:APC family permease n=1 Tax=Lentibacillus halophilus TaxID=295065 RepID=A0ABN0Z1X5_9BACI